jgi:hypothetical protein
MIDEKGYRIPDDKLALRHPVDFQYHQLNWDFLKEMARIAHYASTKYGSIQQYTDSRLVGDKSPMNHMAEHIRQYVVGEEHDHFHTVKVHLVAIAYNAMMEYYYYEKFGPGEYKLHVIDGDKEQG